MRADEAICRRDERGGEPPFPGLLILLTGKGALRELYEARIAGLGLRRVGLRTLWLSPQEYPVLLGSADLGLCLHRSASGVDLPMKISDMFGCGLPVCAFDYGPCLAEQVRHGENGLLFSNAGRWPRSCSSCSTGFPPARRFSIGCAAAPRRAGPSTGRRTGALAPSHCFARFLRFGISRSARNSSRGGKREGTALESLALGLAAARRCLWAYAGAGFRASKIVSHRICLFPWRKRIERGIRARWSIAYRCACS